MAADNQNKKDYHRTTQTVAFVISAIAAVAAAIIAYGIWKYPTAPISEPSKLISNQETVVPQPIPSPSISPSPSPSPLPSPSATAPNSEPTKPKRNTNPQQEYCPLYNEDGTPALDKDGEQIYVPC